MKGRITLLVISVSCINSAAQIEFEKGFFIDSKNERIECLIRNRDWKNNPIGFEYKLSEESEPISIGISGVSEFGIYGFSKYVKEVVRIDRSGDETGQLSQERKPNWSEEQLFLNVLVEGTAWLYHYQEENVNRFFYKNGTAIEQLIYKKYSIDNNNIATNSDFRQQLWKDVRCSDAELNSVESLPYRKNDFIRYFKKYNECTGGEVFSYNRTKNNDVFSLRIAPGIDYTSLKIWNTASNSYGTAVFDSEINFRVGLQAEFTLPFNKNKWGIMTEPTYQYFNSEREMATLAGKATIKYQSIELPIGVRYYFFLNEKSKIFINCFWVLDYNFNSSLRFANDPFLKDLDALSSLAFGAGLDYEKFSIEGRLFTDRDLFRTFIYWQSDYNKRSLIFSYKIF